MDGIHLPGEWYGCPADTPDLRPRALSHSIGRGGKDD